MSEFLLYYKRPDPTTWVYLSSFLTIGLYFVFHRFWSIRNLDIVLLLLLAPGLLMVHEGRRRHLREMESGEIADRATSQPNPDAHIVPTPLRKGQLKTAEEPANKELSVNESRIVGVLLASTATPSTATPSTATPSTATPSTATPSTATPSTATPTVEAASAREPIPSAGPIPIAEPNPLPSIQEETKLPLVTNPDALDERLESTTLDPDQSESDAELSAKHLQLTGFVWLFGVELLILIRLLIDPMMSRRPLLDPNLAVGGLYFISISLFVFMMANVATSTPRMSVWQGPKLGPGYALMHQLPMISTRPVSQEIGAEDPPRLDEIEQTYRGWFILAKTIAIAAHLAIIVGLVLIGNRHFGNLRSGVGCALLYLILPYTAQMTGRVDHCLPAALLLWAVLCYRRPMVAGILLGLAAGLVYYPLFLLPLWCSFYWQRGVGRFAIGIAATLFVLGALLTFGGTETLVQHLRSMFGLFAPTKEPRGIWGVGWDPRWRLPVIVAFGILSAWFAAWPSPKNLGTLIGCSAALMVAVQFWHGYGGGLYIAWFLPLLLLTIFRPNLQDRIAVKVVRGGAKNSSSGNGLSTV